MKTILARLFPRNVADHAATFTTIAAKLRKLQANKIAQSVELRKAATLASFEAVDAERVAAKLENIFA